MTLLRHRDASGPGDGGPPPQDPEAEVVAACPSCGAELAPGQDWCLNCGHAPSGMLDTRPGMRSVAAVVALTLVLCGGAVAAAFAALKHDDGTTTVAVAPPAPAVQEPAPAPAAPAPTETTPPPAGETPLPPDTGTSDFPPATDTPLPDFGPVDPGPADPGPTDPGTEDPGTEDDGSTPPDTDTTPDEPAPVPIELGKDAASAYDPYGRAQEPKVEPERALDGNPGTSWRVTVAPDSPQIGVGLLLDLGELRGVREVHLTTKTPGFRIELYATDSDEVPPTVLDTRWAHIKDRSKVGSAFQDEPGEAVITLGAGTTTYRHVLLWITDPPPDALTVGLTDVSLLG